MTRATAASPPARRHVPVVLQERNVVLYFYPKDDTPGCTAEACSFRDHYEVLKAAGAEVVGVSSDDVHAHEAFVAKYHLPFILLSDPGGGVRNSYGVKRSLGLIDGRDPRFIPFSIADQGLRHHDPLINALGKLLDLPNGRVAVSDVDGTLTSSEWAALGALITSQPALSRLPAPCSSRYCATDSPAVLMLSRQPSMAAICSGTCCQTLLTQM